MAKPESRKNALKKHLIFKYGSLIEASRQLDISYDRLANIISGRAKAKSDEVIHIASQLRVASNDLFGEGIQWTSL